MNDKEILKILENMILKNSVGIGNKKRLAINILKFFQDDKFNNNKKYRQEHRKEISVRDKKYYQKHREERLIYDKKYRQEHREKISVYQKKYRQRIK